MTDIDKKILEIAIKKLSEEFDNFISACTDDRGQPKAPDINKLMKAKACLPPYCTQAFRKSA